MTENPGSGDPRQAAPTYDYTEWPLVVVTMPARDLSKDEIQQHLVACLHPYGRGEPFCWVIDLRQAPLLPAAHRKAIADAMRANSERHPKVVQGSAIVVRTAIERGIVTAIGWVSQPPYPHKAFLDLADAKSWAKGMLAKSGRADGGKSSRTQPSS